MLDEQGTLSGILRPAGTDATLLMPLLRAPAGVFLLHDLQLSGRNSMILIIGWNKWDMNKSDIVCVHNMKTVASAFARNL
jgi:hypothetical protein